MSDSAPKQVWVSLDACLQPTAGLVQDTPNGLPSDGLVPVVLFDSRKEVFVPSSAIRGSRIHDSFEECRAAMIAAWTEDLEEWRKRCHYAAQAIEHIRTIPAVPFPEVVMEPAPEALAPEPPAPPARSDGGSVDPSVPYLVGEDKPKAELKRPSRKAQ